MPSPPENAHSTESPTARPRLVLVCSVGGHFTQMRELARHLSEYECLYVLAPRRDVPLDLRERVVFISHFNRNLNFFRNLWEGWAILRRYRPQALLSTGAGIAVPMAIVGKLLGIPIGYVETMSRVRKPSLTGRIMYFLADRFFYQWPGLGRYFPRGVYGGPVL